jgi:hypothetical protein
MFLKVKDLFHNEILSEPKKYGQLCLLDHDVNNLIALKIPWRWVQLAHNYYPSYLRGRDQEDT